MSKISGLAAGLALFVAPAAVAASLQVITFDDETNRFVSGDTVDEVRTGAGTVVVRGLGPRNPQPNAAMIFDATCTATCSQPDPASAAGRAERQFNRRCTRCTGGDEDLRQPAQRNVLIVSESGLPADPGDSGPGGRLTFDFRRIGPVRIESLVVIDLEADSPATARFYRGDTLIAERLLPAPGNARCQTATLGVAGIERLEIELEGSGAVDDLAFCVGDSLDLECLPAAGLAPSPCRPGTESGSPPSEAPDPIRPTSGGPTEEPAGPSAAPTSTPTGEPTGPTGPTSGTPTGQPTGPAATPTGTPTDEPTDPAATPTGASTGEPTAPTATPTGTPAGEPTGPAAPPSGTPTGEPTGPTATPTGTPTGEPTGPTATPSGTPTGEPTGPTATLTGTPVGEPTGPTAPTTGTPAGEPTGPTATPAGTPAGEPPGTTAPTGGTPTGEPTGPTATPTGTPTGEPPPEDPDGARPGAAWPLFWIFLLLALAATGVLLSSRLRAAKSTDYDVKPRFHRERRWISAPRFDGPDYDVDVRLRATTDAGHTAITED